MRMTIDSFPVIYTQRLVLRALKETDISELFSLRSDETVNRYLDRPKSSHINEVDAFIKKIRSGITENNWYYWAVCQKENNTLIGTFCVWNFSDDKKTAEIGYELHPSLHARGLMSEVLTTMLPFCFEKIKLQRIEAYTHFQNNASTRLLMKHGFKVDNLKKDQENENILVYFLKRE
jgi:[ribosomal protein S5]-alanine N-acetyltransferase